MAYTPIDMSKYPYQTGQKLENGIEITQVVKGTMDDSFLGYAYLEKIYNQRKGTTTLSREVTVIARDPSKRKITNPNIDEGMIDEKGHLCDDNFKCVGPVGDPEAQGVWAKIPGNDHVKFFRPEQFLNLVEKMDKEMAKVKEAEGKIKGKDK